MNLFQEKIKNIFAKKEQKDWLDEVISNAEKHCKEGTTLPFVITGIREKGFIVKVAGLYGFVHFKRMPWHYSTREQWEIAYPFISDKRFFCNIHKIQRDPVRVYIDANVHEFKKFDLTPGESYVGLILSNVKYGVFIDLGYDFNWEYGAMIGLMHKSQFNCTEEMEDCWPGTLMQVRLEGICQSGKLALGRRSEFSDWETGKPQALLGKQTWALVKKNKPGSKAFFSIKGIYTGEPIIELLKND